jgi:hypothetical protein
MKTHQDFSTHKARKYINLQWVEVTGNIHQKEFNIMEQEQAAIKWIILLRELQHIEQNWITIQKQNNETISRTIT